MCFHSEEDQFNGALETWKDIEVIFDELPQNATWLKI